MNLGPRRREMRRPQDRIAESDVSPTRVVLAVSAATLLAVIGHLVGGGSVALSCAVLLCALGTSAVTTSGATWVAHRVRGSSGALAVLTLGQLLIEAILSVPAHRLPTAPLSGAVMHGVAVIAVASLLMGTARTFRPVAAVVGQWLPVSLPLTPTRWPRRVNAPLVRRVLGAGFLGEHGPLVPRGPPLLRLAPPRP